MSEDISDMMKKVNDMINSGNIPDNVKEVMNNLKSNTSSDNSEVSNNSGINPDMINNIMNMLNQNSNSKSSDSNSNNFSGIDINTMLKMKSIMDKMNSNKDDPRANLLLSLKPYLKESRKDKVEQYVKLLNMSKVIDVFKPDGGEKQK